MEYNGEVSVTGPAQTLTTQDLEISKLAVGPFDNNTYLLRCKQTGASLLIDAANDPDRILALTGPNVDQILTTHSHPDHYFALQEVVDATGAQTLATAAEAAEISVATDVIVADGDTVAIGDASVEILTLRGHRMWGSDHVCTSAAVVHRDSDGSTHIFTGDSLFPGGVGNTCDDAESYRQLLGDVVDKIFDRFPDDARIYPGHGFDTTLGAERPSLPAWQAPTVSD